jgi:Tol biopolymer transport system component
MTSFQFLAKRKTKDTFMIAIVISLSLLFSACKSDVIYQVSYVGPTIEDIRDMYIIENDGTNKIQLFPKIRGLGTVLIWHPGGEQAIVFVEEEGEYYVGDTVQGELGACLTCDFDQYGGPAYSPDGESIVWSGEDGIFLMNSDGAALTRVTDIPQTGWLNWSPDGKQIVFTIWKQRLEIHRLEMDSGIVAALTEYDGSEKSDHYAPSWSPSGDRIAFHMLNRDGLRVMVMNSDGSGMKEVVSWITTDEIYDPGFEQPPQWSPDGEHLVFSSTSSFGDMDIFIVDIHGGGLINLTSHPGNDRNPVWSPDGEKIVFISNRDGDLEIYVMNADGSNQLNLSNSPITNESNPAWRIKP